MKTIELNSVNLCTWTEGPHLQINNDVINLIRENNADIVEIEGSAIQLIHKVQKYDFTNNQEYLMVLIVTLRNIYHGLLDTADSYKKLYDMIKAVLPLAIVMAKTPSKLLELTKDAMHKELEEDKRSHSVNIDLSDLDYDEIFLDVKRISSVISKSIYLIGIIRQFDEDEHNSISELELFSRGAYAATADAVDFCMWALALAIVRRLSDEGFPIYGSATEIGNTMLSGIMDDLDEETSHPAE